MRPAWLCLCLAGCPAPQKVDEGPPPVIALAAPPPASAEPEPAETAAAPIAVEAEPQDPGVGAPAPEITGARVAGTGPATLAAARGQVVIVDFWATFCEPCKRSFPEHQALVDRHAGKVAVIAVSVDDPEDIDERDIAQFLSATGAKFATVWDRDHATVERYQPPRMPTTYVVDRTGVLRHVEAGYDGDSAARIAALVDALLAE